MSSNTWTREELLASAVVIETTAWRLVEAQHRISTMKLVDSLDEQIILEQMLEETKPSLQDDCAGLHYLLASPFRYSRNSPYATRFRRANSEHGVFYASASPETAVAEIVFYRLLFFAESPETPLPSNPGEFTAFAVQICATRSLDLTRPPMSAYHELWENPQDYTYCQDVSDTAREEGMQVISYHSIRDLRHRLNHALMTPAAFSQPYPVAEQTWWIDLRKEGVLAKCEAPLSSLSFSKLDFDIDSRIRAGM